MEAFKYTLLKSVSRRTRAKKNNKEKRGPACHERSRREGAELKEEVNF